MEGVLGTLEQGGKVAGSAIPGGHSEIMFARGNEMLIPPMPAGYNKAGFMKNLLWILVLVAGCGRSMGVLDTPPVCGNGLREALELCDGQDLGGQSCGSLGLGAGELSCREDCTVDTSRCGMMCGNGRVDGEEQCDGDELDGMTCETMGFIARITNHKTALKVQYKGTVDLDERLGLREPWWDAGLARWAGASRRNRKRFNCAPGPLA